jgi:teichuronic acid biosynthesis glycosyltransferase TuaC
VTESRSADRSKTVRTLLFSTLFPSSTRNVHGLFVQARLRELMKLGGIDTQVVAPVPWVPWMFRGSPRYSEMYSTPAHEILECIPVHHPRYLVIPKFGMSLVPVAMAVAAMPTILRIQRNGFDFDLIDAHYYFPDGVAAALLGKWLSKPVVITARGTDLLLIARYRLPVKEMKWAAESARASIGVCNALTNVLRDWGIAERKLNTFRNGVDLERFAPIPTEAARSKLSIRGSPVILSVGHLVRRKGHDVVISAMTHLLKSHPSAHLYIIGDGEERNSLLDLVRNLDLGSKVTLVGAIRNEMLPPWYSAADLLVLASYREGWPNVVLEAMACGTPVVAADVGGVAEILTQPALGRVMPSREPEEVASIARQMLDNLPPREEVRNFAATMSWEQTSIDQLNLFGEIARAKIN